MTTAPVLGHPVPDAEVWELPEPVTVTDVKTPDVRTGQSPPVALAVPAATTTDDGAWWAPLAEYGARTPAEVLAHEGDRNLFLIDGIVHSGLTLLYGPSEIGKTHLVASLVRAIAAGTEWFGHATHGGGVRVLVLASDPGGVREYAERIGGDAEGIVVTRPPTHVSSERWRTLTDETRRLGVGLVVLDNVYSWAPGADVNANAEVGAVLSCLDPFIDHGIAVLLVHHTPKENTRTPAGAHNIQAKARHSIRLPSRTAMEVHGNNTAKATYVVTRQGGRSPTSPWQSHRTGLPRTSLSEPPGSQ